MPGEALKQRFGGFQIANSLITVSLGFGQPGQCLFDICPGGIPGLVTSSCCRYLALNDGGVGPEPTENFKVPDNTEISVCGVEHQCLLRTNELVASGDGFLVRLVQTVHPGKALEQGL